MSQKVNFQKALKSDFSLCIPLVVTFTCILFIALLFFIKKDCLIEVVELALKSDFSFLKNEPFFAYLISYILVIIVSIIVFFRRLHFLKKFETREQRVVCLIHKIKNLRDKVCIEIIFEFMGQEYTCTYSLILNSLTKNFHLGSRLELFVNESNPSKSILYHLYF